eukprot:2773700-Heterocapsa_arctica.AAC.1
MPRNEEIINNESTDEQTNHKLFNGKEVRKKAMLKAKQIQTHKREQIVKARQGSVTADKSDTEDNSEVTKNIKMFQNGINEKNKRDAQEREQTLNNNKTAEKKEKNNIEQEKDNKRQSDLQELSRSYVQQEHGQADQKQEVETEESILNDFTQNKKPRIYDNNFSQNNIMDRMKKRKDTQYQFRHVHAPKRGNISYVAEGFAQ